MKKGDKIDLVLSRDDNNKPVAKIAGIDQEIPLERAKEGVPLPEDVILLQGRTCPKHRNTLHAEVVHCPEPPSSSNQAQHSGPARVSNFKYRSGWDQVFGDKTLLN